MEWKVGDEFTLKNIDLNGLKNRTVPGQVFRIQRFTQNLIGTKGRAVRCERGWYHDLHNLRQLSKLEKVLK